MKLCRRILSATVFIALVSALCIVSLKFGPAPILRLDNLVYDAWLKLAKKPEPHPALAIVDIDEESLARKGQWPWPRTMLAELVSKIMESGALAIGLDMLLSEPDRSSPAYLRENLKDHYGLDIAISGIPPELMDNDLFFSEVIKDKPIVLGAYAVFDEERMPETPPKSLGSVELKPPAAPDPRKSVKEAKGLLPPIRKFTDPAPIGIINATVPEDGVIRSVPLLTRLKDNLYGALSLRTLMAAQGNGTLLLQSDMDGLKSLKSIDISIPVEPDGSYRPFYMGPSRTYPYISAADILDGGIDRGQLEGRIIFIGSSASGLLDMRSTPLDPSMPGVEVHATIVDNMLSGLKITVPPNIDGLQILLIVFSACAAYFLFAHLSAIISIFSSLVIIAAYLWASWLCFTGGEFISPIYAVLATGLMGFMIIPLRFWQEQKSKKLIKAAFAHYVSPEAVNRIVSEGTAALAGQSRELSVLFTDVRGFTTISEKLEPGELVRLLNSYFTPMTACVIKRDGTLDKFIGDALMAFWNAPLNVEGHQEKAVLAALDMQKALDSLRPAFVAEFGVKIRIGAGIHCGIAQVGNMGSDDLLNYTCIGDNVNLASRLESLTKRYGVGIIVSSTIKEQCGNLVFRHLDRIRVKGSSRPLDIYTPLEGDIDADMEHQWQKALEAYFNGDFNESLRLFKEINGFDVAVALFIERCSHFLANRPEKWDGVWTYDSK